VSTFIEDGIRMWMQWGDQRDYIMKSWNVGWFIGTMFVIINLLGQLVPCGMILLRKKTDIACGILVFIIGFQVSLFLRKENKLFRSALWFRISSFVCVYEIKQN